MPPKNRSRHTINERRAPLLPPRAPINFLPNPLAQFQSFSLPYARDRRKSKSTRFSWPRTSLPQVESNFFPALRSKFCCGSFLVFGHPLVYTHEHITARSAPPMRSRCARGARGAMPVFPHVTKATASEPAQMRDETIHCRCPKLWGGVLDIFEQIPWNLPIADAGRPTTRIARRPRATTRAADCAPWGQNQGILFRRIELALNGTKFDESPGSGPYGRLGKQRKRASNARMRPR